MGIYKNMHCDQHFNKKEGYKKPKVIEKSAENPLDYMEAKTSAGTCVRVTRCSRIEFGVRCGNAGTINSGGGWVCGKHCRS